MQSTERAKGVGSGSASGDPTPPRPKVSGPVPDA